MNSDAFTPAKAGVQSRWIPARQTAVGRSAGVVWRTASAGMTTGLAVPA